MIQRIQTDKVVAVLTIRCTHPFLVPILLRLLHCPHLPIPYSSSNSLLVSLRSIVHRPRCGTGYGTFIKFDQDENDEDEDNLSIAR